MFWHPHRDPVEQEIYMELHQLSKKSTWTYQRVLLVREEQTEERLASK